MEDIYVDIIKAEINSVIQGGYENMKCIETYPVDSGIEVLKILLQYACSTTNMSVIATSRKKISDIPYQWLKTYCCNAVKESVCLDDDWDYRRLLELIRNVIPEYMEWGITLGIDSANNDIREIAYDFKEI